MTDEIRSFQDAEKFIYSFTNYERGADVQYNSETYNISAFRDFLSRLGSPHKDRKSVHIGGTKGKGATAAFIASLLTAHSATTGLYTSPHLVNIRERIRYQGKSISENDFTFYAGQIWNILTQDHKELRRSYRTTFELLTAIAFSFFKDKNVQYDVLEVGMGGRLDCTNVVLPKLTVLTPISKDHVESLGHTLEKIAFEKAGIIKNEVPLISARQPKPAMEVIEKFTRKQHAQLLIVQDKVKTKIKSMDEFGSLFDLKIGNTVLKNMFIRLPGDFQIENAATAVLALHELNRNYLVDLQEKFIREGLGSLNWPGRFSFLPSASLLPHKPAAKILIDGAHNPAASRKLADAIKTLFPGVLFTTILAAPSNKDIRNIIKNISPITNTLILSQYSNSRSASLEQLEEAAIEFHPRYQKIIPLSEAIRFIDSSTRFNGNLLITGSLYLSGEIYQMAGLSQDVLDIF